jgi:1,2-phenylacetyl-CoA epoxidase PaaB subunit
MMPRYKVKATHWLILEAEVSFEASDYNKAQEMVRNMRDRGTFGVVAWEVKDSPITNWHAVERAVEIESLQEEE